MNREERILGATASSSVNSTRSLAHHISDKVYEAITGVPGAFSTKLAYVTLQRSGGKALYRLQVSDVDGKRAKVRLESDEPILSPAWSPDGKRLAYVSFETGKPAIYIHELSSGNRTRIADFRGLNSAPAWGPDGRSLLMTLSKDGNAEVYKMDIQSRSLKRLTNHWSIDTEPTWIIRVKVSSLRLIVPVGRRSTTSPVRVRNPAGLPSVAATMPARGQTMTASTSTMCIRETRRFI